MITDYSMPRLMGLDLTRALLVLRPDIPIVMITGFIEDQPTELATAAGVRRLLRKPVRMQELGEALQAVLAESAKSKPPAS